jgi:beta-galactosidase
VPAGQSATVRVTQPWDNPHLWWPDDPYQYVVSTTVEHDGKPIDRAGTAFGFREWGWSGTSFTLNGVPWHFRADLRHNDRESGRRPDLAVREWWRNGQNTFRFWGDEPWTGRTQADTLGFFDRAGIAVRRSGIFDGEVASYQLVTDGKPHQALFDNWRKQLAAWIKAERNHPSVLVWSLENEVTYINARNSAGSSRSSRRSRRRPSWSCSSTRPGPS